MPALFQHSGIRFYYPENWTLIDDELDGWPRSVTVESQETSFWTLHVYPPGEDTGPLLDKVIESIRDVYPDMDEVLEAKETFGQTETKGVDVCFFFLDLLVEAHIRALQTPLFTLIWHCQAESREFEKMEPVFCAIATSLLQSQVVAEK